MYTRLFDLSGKLRRTPGARSSRKAQSWRQALKRSLPSSAARAASARASLPAFLQARCRAADIRRLCLMRISPAPPSLSHLASTSMRAAPRICSSPAIQTRARRSCPLTLFSTTRPTPSFGAVLLLQALLLSSGATCCGMMLTTCLSICLPEQATFL